MRKSGGERDAAWSREKGQYAEKRVKEGVRFNEEIHRLPTGNFTFIPKGVYHFKTHEEANRRERDCIVKGMVRIAQGRVLEFVKADKE